MDWDLTTYFDSFGSKDYERFNRDLENRLNELSGELQKLPPLRKDSAGSWIAWLGRYESLVEKFSHLGSYLSCLTAADANNDDYARAYTDFDKTRGQLKNLQNELIFTLGAVDEKDFKAAVANEEGEDLAYLLDRLRQQAKYQMSQEAESLAMDLANDGINAWSRLYFSLTGVLTFEYINKSGEAETLPLSRLRSLLAHPDRSIRLAASKGAETTWQEHGKTFTSTLNAISGTRHTLNDRRGIEDFLEPSLFDARISRKTLDAMFEAINGQLPFAREVLKTRVKAMGIEKATYSDIYAPVGGNSSHSIDWDQATQMIHRAFSALYPALADFFKELIDKRWVDYSPRSGKRPGGFCSSSQMTRESRIFMTYQDVMSDVMTLAHEAGHAWHTRVLNRTRSLNAGYPMTLAESASTFAEQILANGILADPGISDEAKLEILDADTGRTVAFLLDIPVRFSFEKRVYEERRQGELSTQRLKQIMTEEQRRVFGDALAEGGEDPWFWASKLHFYINEVQFYNYPYTFGYLLSVALFQRLIEEGVSFLPQYESFLAGSGSRDCEDLIRDTLGEDIESPEFWDRSIQVLQKPFQDFQNLMSVKS